MDETAEVNNGKSVQIFKYRLPQMCEKNPAIVSSKNWQAKIYHVV